VIQQLHGDEALIALPLMQMRHPELTPDTWQDFVKTLEGDGGGVVSVRCENGYVYGLLVYESQRTDDGEQAISVTDIVSLKLTGQENSRSKLLDWIDHHARESACNRVEINLS
jgi:hypothetical protein